MITKLLGIATLLGSLACVYMFESSSSMTGMLRIFHWPALILTGVGPLGLMLMCSDGKLLGRMLSALLGPSPRRKQAKLERDGMFLQRLGKSFYAEGPKAFEDLRTRGISEMAQKVVDRLSVRMPTPDIRELMQTERDRRHSRLVQCINTVALGVRLSPSVGMLGTILGMVQLLNTLQDPTHIGSHMSLALLTTFYGLFFSLAIWTPLQQRIERTLDVELEGYNQLIQWLDFLEKRKPSNYFSETMEIPVPRQEREEQQAAHAAKRSAAGGE